MHNLLIVEYLSILKENELKQLEWLLLEQKDKKGIYILQYLLPISKGKYVFNDEVLYYKLYKKKFKKENQEILQKDFSKLKLDIQKAILIEKVKHTDFSKDEPFALSLSEELYKRSTNIFLIETEKYIEKLKKTDGYVYLMQLYPSYFNAKRAITTTNRAYRDLLQEILDSQKYNEYAINLLYFQIKTIAAFVQQSNTNNEIKETDDNVIKQWMIDPQKNNVPLVNIYKLKYNSVDRNDVDKVIENNKKLIDTIPEVKSPHFNKTMELLVAYNNLLVGLMVTHQYGDSLEICYIIEDDLNRNKHYEPSMGIFYFNYINMLYRAEKYEEANKLVVKKEKIINQTLFAPYFKIVKIYNKILMRFDVSDINVTELEKIEPELEIYADILHIILKYSQREYAVMYQLIETIKLKAHRLKLEVNFFTLFVSQLQFLIHFKEKDKHEIQEFRDELITTFDELRVDSSSYQLMPQIWVRREFNIVAN